MNVEVHIKTACGEETVVDYLESLYISGIQVWEHQWAFIWNFSHLMYFSIF